ncbi:HNH endonuclease [Streptomyces sp. NPDC058279]|uniref:HNH endonuclease n=1 Tax=Streptomyces sp. NPDC058279 TaxID=3346418 RepID=UPI0036E674F8
MRTHQLNARRRRARKFQLAVRDGAHCTYCLAPFAHLRHATLDHVVPFHLLRTWSAGHLVLACRPCNHAKANRFPLLIALLLIHAVDGVDASTVHPDVHPTSTLDRSTVPAGVSPLIESGGHGVDRVDVHRFVGVFTPDALRLLARLAHARQSGDRTAVESGGRSGVHQGVHRVHEHPRAAVYRSSRGGREADRPARTRLCSAPHGPARTPRRESA